MPLLHSRQIRALTTFLSLVFRGNPTDLCALNCANAPNLLRILKLPKGNDRALYPPNADSTSASFGGGSN